MPIFFLYHMYLGKTRELEDILGAPRMNRIAEAQRSELY
jgi:hypothetical protein